MQRIKLLAALALIVLGLLLQPAFAQATLRGTGMQASSAASYTVSWPSGTVAGDMAIIQYGGAYTVTTPPSGWNVVVNTNQGNWNGMTIWKILTSSDISTGSVVITPANTFHSAVGIVTVETGTFDATAAPNFVYQNDTGGASTRTLNAFVPTTNDLAVYISTNRAASTNTVSIGTNQRQVNDGSSASGAIYTQNPSSTTPSPVFSFSATGSGDTVLVASIPATRTLPSWLRGSWQYTLRTSDNSATFVMPWPPGTVSGDTDVIIVAGDLATIPSGWTQLDHTSSLQWQGAAFYKVLNSTDISNGSVSITMSGIFSGFAGEASIKSSALSGYSAPVATVNQHTSGASSRTVNYTSTTTNDYALYFGSYRGAGAATVNLGTLREGATDGVTGSGTLYVGQPASVGTISPTFSYSATSGGDYQGTILFAAPAVAAGGKGFFHSFPPIVANDNEQISPKLLLRSRP